MKNFLFIFVLLLVGLSHFPIQAQIKWDIQTAQGLTVFSDPIMIFSAVDHNICWGIENFELGHGIMNPKFAITTNGGTNWNVSQAQIPSGSGVEAIFSRDAQTAWIAVYNPNNGSNSGIYKTTNGGVNWQQQDNAFSGDGHPIIIYFFNKSDTGICVGTPRNNHFEIYTTINGGVNWNSVLNVPASDAADVFPTGFTGSGNTFIFGTVLRKIYKSIDRGVTWTKMSYPAPSGSGVDIQLNDSLNGLACTYFGDHINRVSKTTDGGTTWNSQPLPPAQPSFYFLSYVPGTSGTYIVTSHNNYSWNDEVTTPGSVFTRDTGATWISIDNIPHGPASFSDDGWGWSSGIGDTIYRIYKDDLIVGVRNENNFAVNEFSLEQNYPNPFNPSTSIKYSIPTSELVTLKVYDALGSEVATLANDEKPAGSYEVRFNGTALPSGIYFYQLKSGSFIESKKMVLMK